MGVELRWVIEGECRCGEPLSPGENHPRHWHHLESPWGRVEHSCPRPDRGEVGHLMLADLEWVAGVLGSEGYRRAGGWWTATTAPDEQNPSRSRIFCHLEYPPTGERWTWEMFAAEITPSRPEGARPLLLGKWPD